MRRIALLLFAALTLGMPSPASVSAVPMIYSCAQVDFGVLSLWAEDPGWKDENGEHGAEDWFHWRIHGPGVDQVLYEGYMPTKRFETNARIWGLQGGKTYQIEYWEEIPGYGGFKGDVLSCTVQGTSGLAFGFALTLDGTTPDYPKAPAATPTPAPTRPPATVAPTALPSVTPRPTSSPTPKAPTITTPSPSTPADATNGASPLPSAIASAALNPDATPSASDIQAVSDNGIPLQLLVGVAGLVIGLLLLVASKRTERHRD